MSLASTWNRLLWLWRHRWTVLNVFLASIPAGYALLPADWLPYIPPQIKSGLAIALLASIGMQAVAKIVPKDPTQ